MTDNVHIRLTLTRGVKITSGMDPRLNQSGPTLIVLPEHKAPVYDAGGITLITASIRRTAPDSLDPKIHHNNLLTSILAKIEANVAGADDAVMLDQRGFVAETNATHLFLVTGGVLAHAHHRRLPRGHHQAGSARPCRRRGHPGRIRRLQPDPALLPPTSCSSPAPWAASRRCWNWTDGRSETASRAGSPASSPACLPS